MLTNPYEDAPLKPGQNPQTLWLAATRLKFNQAMTPKGAFLGEILGTLLPVLPTVESAANAALEPRLAPGAYGHDAIALGLELAVRVGALARRPLPGSQLNPP
ncbi:hypothetical protein Thermus72351_23740 [Thermus brockianus]